MPVAPCECLFVCGYVDAVFHDRQGKQLSLRTAVIALWVFSLLCLVALIVIFYLSDRYKAQKYRNDLFDLTNRMMAENYQHLYDKQRAYAKETHDFHHHLWYCGSWRTKGMMQVPNSISIPCWKRFRWRGPPAKAAAM